MVSKHVCVLQRSGAHGKEALYWAMMQHLLCVLLLLPLMQLLFLHAHFLLAHESSVHAAHFQKNVVFVRAKELLNMYTYKLELDCVCLPIN